MTDRRPWPALEEGGASRDAAEHAVTTPRAEMREMGSRWYASCCAPAAGTSASKTEAGYTRPNFGRLAFGD